LKIHDYGLWFGSHFKDRRLWTPSDGTMPISGDEQPGYLFFAGRPLGQFNIRRSFTTPKSDLFCFFYLWADSPYTLIIPRTQVDGLLRGNLCPLLSAIFIDRYLAMNEILRPTWYDDVSKFLESTFENSGLKILVAEARKMIVHNVF
jgi:hypothetical protein